MSGKTRWILVAVALAGATCFTIAVQVSTWWSIDGVITVRPLGTRSCFQAGECMKGDLGFLGGGELWRRSGVAVWTAGMIAALALVALAGALAAKRRGTTVAGVTLVASMTALVSGLVFFLRFPGMSFPGGMGEGLPSPPTAHGSGAPLYFAGALVAAAVAVIILRRKT